MSDRTCPFCASQLKGHSEAEFKGNVTFTGDCPRCGTYTLTPDLVAELPNLEQETRDRVAAFLQQAWDALGVPQELDLNFVKVQLYS
jgi:hypothetical protein